MGFVQFPASDTEPAKSSSGVAQHLAHVYKEYLAAFDNDYVAIVMENRKNEALTATSRPMMNPGGIARQWDENLPMLLNGQQLAGSPSKRWPNQKHLPAALAHITKLKSDLSLEWMLQSAPALDIPAEQRMEYNTVLEQLHTVCMELDPKLPTLFAALKLKREDILLELVFMVQTAIHQREMISSDSPRFFVTLDFLHTMLQQVQEMNDFLHTDGIMCQNRPMPPNGQQFAGSPPKHPQQGVAWPSEEQLQAASAHIKKLKSDFRPEHITKLASIHILERAIHPRIIECLLKLRNRDAEGDRSRHTRGAAYGIQHRS
ncbi:hypothetical protein B0H19DRAFT_1169638 [Mycena capillaripes]|nr:hypothetical protein B0H19DRAFT_1169638 [Mycena capillaripes]